jgi:hypothetical protein
MNTQYGSLLSAIFALSVCNKTLSRAATISPVLCILQSRHDSQWFLLPMHFLWKHQRMLVTTFYMRRCAWLVWFTP